MNNRRAGTSIIIGVVAIIATFLIFVISKLPINSKTICGLLFLIYSELVLFGGIAAIEYLAHKSSQIIIRAGVGTLLVIYSLAVFIPSLVYINYHYTAVGSFLIYQIIILLVAFVISWIMIVSAKTRYENDAKVLAHANIVKNMENELILIKEQYKRDEINKLIEGIRYMDVAASVDADVEIDKEISKLKEMLSGDNFNESEFGKKIEEIEWLISKRNLQAKASKRGGI